MQRAPDMTRARSVVEPENTESSQPNLHFQHLRIHPIGPSRSMMPVSRWFLVVGAAVAVVVALSSPYFTATAAARPLPYAVRSSSSLDCATVMSLLAGCKAFFRRGVAAASRSVLAPGAACCEGVAELYAVASDSADNWRSVCGCMAGLVRRYPSNASAIALLPALCAVLPPAGRAAGDSLTYCTSSS